MNPAAPVECNPTEAMIAAELNTRTDPPSRALRAAIEKPRRARRLDAQQTPTQGTKPMAFAIRNLSVLAYANGFTLWHYKADPDTLATVKAPDFFGDGADMLKVGGMILVSASDGGALLIVMEVADGKVTVAPVGA